MVTSIRSRFALTSLFVFAAAPALTGCDIVLGINGDYTVASAPASGGAGGAGVTSAASTSTTVATSTGASSSTGLPIPCAPDYDGPLEGTEPNRCPVGMVLVEGQLAPDQSMVAPFCIQSREVTFADYAMIATTGRHCFQDEHPLVDCRNNDPFSLIAASVFTDPAVAALPVHPVDHCDADSYCLARGLRLCTEPEWRSACANAGGAWPWSSMDGHACTLSPDIAEGAASTCNGDASDPIRSRVFDMVGNVAEHFAAPRYDPARSVVLGAQINVSGILDNDGEENCAKTSATAFKDVVNHDDAMRGNEPLPSTARAGIRCCADPR